MADRIPGVGLYQLRIFGGLHLDGPGGGAVGLASRRRPLALLAALAAQGEQGLSRDRAAALLWGDTDDRHALRSLSDALYTIRAELGPDAVLSSATELKLNPSVVESDVAAFTAALRRGDRAAAVAAWGGPLLEGFHVAGAESFEEWLDGARRRFGGEFSDALEGLAAAARKKGDFAAAVGWLRRLAALDPYNSRVAIELARTLVQARDPGNALQLLRDHVRELRSALGAEPDAAVLRLIAELRAGSAAAPAGVEGLVRPGRPLFDTGSGDGWGSDDGSAAGAGPRGAGASGAPAGSAGRRSTAGRALQLVATRPGLAAVALVVLGVAGWGALRLAQARFGPPIRRLVVLPLRNLTGDTTLKPLVDGMTEELTARLGQVAGLEVVSRTTAEHYRDTKLSSAAIAAELGVEGLLEGAVVRWAPRLHVTIQVIDARRDLHLGAKTVDLSSDSLDVVPAELAHVVMQSLRIEPTLEEQRRLETHVSRNPRVTALLTQGRWEEALAADSSDARAWAARSIAMSMKSWMPTDSPSWRATPYVLAAKEAAARAVSLDSNESEAQHALGVAASVNNDYQLAERALRRAIALQPSNAVAISDLAGLLPLVGRTDEALAEARRATRLDPLSGMVRVSLNWVLLVARRWDEYERAAQEWLRIWPSPDSLASLIGGSLMIVRFCQGRPEEAAASLDTSLQINHAWASRAYDPMRLIILAKLGRLDEARAMLRRLEARSWTRQFWLAWAYAAVGETEKAVAAYRNSAAMYEGGLQGTVLTCLADPLRTDPRWPELLGLLNIRP